jgi:hypothetical protein
VKAAYLNAKVKGDVYVYPCKEMNMPKGTILKLHRALYGLKEAAKSWYDEFSTFLLSIGFLPVASEKGLFKSSSMQLAIHVDDTIVAYKNEKLLDDFIAILAEKYELSEVKKDFDSTLFLGMTIAKQPDGYIMHQGVYIDKMLEKFCLKDCKITGTPMRTSYLAGQGSTVDIALFRKIVGGLLWVATQTRPDISYAVSRLTEVTSSPHASDHTAAIDVLRYLKGTKQNGLYYKKGTSVDQRFDVYVDSDWGRDVKGKSRSAFVVYYASAPIHWRTFKQSCIALASNEAELVALSDCCRDLAWLGYVVGDLMPINARSLYVHSDSQGAIATIKTIAADMSRRSKHIRIRYFYAREFFDEFTDNTNLNYIATANNVADIFTKPLAKPAFVKFAELLVS